MVEQLGAHLVRKGLVTQAQLDEALKSQLIYGGSLGTNLVELGLLDLATLGQSLSDTFHFPLATEAELAAVPAETVALLRPDLARNHLAFPLALEGRRLRVAMAEPQDPRHVDSLGFATGMRIVPSIVSEPRLLQLLERHYGIPRPVRPGRPGHARAVMGQGAAPIPRPGPAGLPPGVHALPEGRSRPPSAPVARPAGAAPAPMASPPMLWARDATAEPPRAPPPPGTLLSRPGPFASPVAAHLPPGMVPRGAVAVAAPRPQGLSPAPPRAVTPPSAPLPSEAVPGSRPAPSALAPSVASGVAVTLLTLVPPAARAEPLPPPVPVTDERGVQAGSPSSEGPAKDPFASPPPRTAELFTEAPDAPAPVPVQEVSGALAEAPLLEAVPAPWLSLPSVPPPPPVDPEDEELEASRETPIVAGRMIRGVDLPLTPLGTLEVSSDMDFIESDSGSASWAQRAIEVDFTSIEPVDADGLPLTRVHEFLPVWEPPLEEEGDARCEDTLVLPPSPPRPALPEVMDALRRATSRGQLGQALLSYSRGRFPRSFLLGETFGAIRVGLACGEGSDRPEVSALKVDLASPSLLARAASDGGPVVSNEPGSRMDEALFAALGQSLSHLMAAPIRVRQRAVGFVVIDGGPAPFGAEELDELERLLSAASEAYGRLHDSSF